jgi:hypothetical protein
LPTATELLSELEQSEGSSVVVWLWLGRAEPPCHAS